MNDHIKHLIGFRFSAPGEYWDEFGYEPPCILGFDMMLKLCWEAWGDYVGYVRGENRGDKSRQDCAECARLLRKARTVKDLWAPVYDYCLCESWDDFMGAAYDFEEDADHDPAPLNTDRLQDLGPVQDCSCLDWPCCIHADNHAFTTGGA